MKIMNIIGTRPQFIKYAMIEKELHDHTNILVHSGQHYDKGLFKIFFDEFNLGHPHYNIGIGSGSYGWQVGELIERIYDIIEIVKPDCVLVYGDCNTTYAGAVATNLHRLPLAHIESGLRCFDWKMIEEFNRVQTDHCSQWCFAPTKSAMKHLSNEGLSKKSYLVGNLHYECFLHFHKKIMSSTILDTFKIKPDTFYLATIHRFETLHDYKKLQQVFNAFKKLEYPVVIPMHPHLKKTIDLMKPDLSNVYLKEALGYFDIQNLIRNARLVITDSGGLTTESYFHKQPCIIIRDYYEYTDIPKGWNVLVGTDTNKIIESVETMMPGRWKNVFGDGNTSKKILKILEGTINEYR